MAEVFHSFVIFAGMRTGSNLLEGTLNAIKYVTCFGEAFNPYMMGWPDKDEMLGISMAARDADPSVLLGKIFGGRNLCGFRYFADHDPRVFDPVMQDRGCAKIILTRNPVDSYVSTRLAWKTQQWKLNETETPIPAAIRFDAAEFRQVLDESEAFHLRILHGLQTSGQTAYWLSYDDLRDSDVMTGLLHWLGRSDLEKVQPATDLVPQNPRPAAEKVENFDEMRAEIARIDPFRLGRVPTFEPRRGPSVPSFLALSEGQGLLYQPLRGGPDLGGWLRAQGAVQGDFTQNSLRQWMRAHAGHRSFSVLRHPLHRAWNAFGAMIEGGNADLRQVMREVHRVPLPPDAELALARDSDLATAFAAFLAFLKRNLAGQTTLAVHPGWASQVEVIAGFSRIRPPDLLVREDRLAEDLGWITLMAGLQPAALPEPESLPAFLDDADLRKAAKAAYPRDYLTFGFED